MASAAISSSVCGMGSTLVGDAAAAMGDGVIDGEVDGKRAALRGLFRCGMGDQAESSLLA